MIRDLNRRPQAITLLEPIEEALKPPGEREIKASINKWDYIKLRIFRIADTQQSKNVIDKMGKVLAD